jgi:cytochrome c-type biogenesis protein CcmH
MKAAWVALGLCAVLPFHHLAAQSRGDSVARLAVPQAVQERAVTTARDDDSLVQAIKNKIHCTCGCNLDVFKCLTTELTSATSPAMHRQVLARLDSNMTSAQVVAAFEAQYGQVILMQPPRRGFNWAAYVMPFVALAVGLLIVGLWMRRWVRVRPRAGVPVDPSAGAPVRPSAEDELERLQRELEKFEA